MTWLLTIDCLKAWVDRVLGSKGNTVQQIQLSLQRASKQAAMQASNNVSLVRWPCCMLGLLPRASCGM